MWVPPSQESVYSMEGIPSYEWGRKSLHFAIAIQIAIPFTTKRKRGRHLCQMPPLLWIPFPLFVFFSLSAAIIMDINSSAAYINNNYALNQHHGVQSIEELKQLLVHVDATKYRLELQNQILETKLQRLQDLVVVMRRERDEAMQQRDQTMEQLYLLRQQITQQSNIISKTTWANKPIGSSPLGLENVPADQSSSRSLIADEVEWDWHQPVRRFDFTADPDDFAPDGHMIDPSEKQPVFDLAEDEEDVEQNNNNNDDLSFFKQDEDSDSLRRFVENQNHDLWQNETYTPTPAVRNTTSGCMAEASSCMAYNNQLPPQPARVLSAPMDAMPLHLPEPPEADPDVMLSTLPERGKFLEAVMQAGPLLNTLLLAGPLPQWRHPPPALETVEIPMLSMRSSPSFGHMQRPHMTSSDSQPVAQPISSTHQNTGLDIKDPQQLSSSTLSKFLCWPSVNSQDSAMMGSPLKYAKIH